MIMNVKSVLWSGEELTPLVEVHVSIVAEG